MAKSYTGEDIIIGTGADPARASFVWLDKPRPPKASVLLKNPHAPHKYESSFLLDPSNKAHAANIAAIKKSALALAELGGFTPKQVKQRCFGMDTDLDKEFDGYKGMFWIKAREERRPVIRNRNNKDVIPGEPQFPYGGCYVIGKLSLWLYTNETIGIGANLKVVQYVKKGAAFGRPEESADEFAPLPPMEEGEEDSGFLDGAQENEDDDIAF
jgi:hypothetical protein